jgi:hypothetical protein
MFFEERHGKRKSELAQVCPAELTYIYIFLENELYIYVGFRGGGPPETA